MGALHRPNPLLTGLLVTLFSVTAVSAVSDTLSQSEQAATDEYGVTVYASGPDDSVSTESAEADSGTAFDSGETTAPPSGSAQSADFSVNTDSKEMSALASEADFDEMTTPPNVDSDEMTAPPSNADSAEMTAPPSDFGETVAPPSGFNETSAPPSDSGETLAPESGMSADGGETVDFSAKAYSASTFDSGETTAPPAKSNSGKTTDSGGTFDSGGTTAPPAKTDSGATAAPPAQPDSGATAETLQPSDSGATTNSARTPVSGTTSSSRNNAAKAFDSGETTAPRVKPDSGATTPQPAQPDSGATTPPPAQPDSGATTDSGKTTDSGATTSSGRTPVSGATNSGKKTDSGKTFDPGETTGTNPVKPSTPSASENPENMLPTNTPTPARPATENPENQVPVNTPSTPSTPGTPATPATPANPSYGTLPNKSPYQMTISDVYTPGRTTGQYFTYQGSRIPVYAGVQARNVYAGDFIWRTGRRLRYLGSRYDAKFGVDVSAYQNRDRSNETINWAAAKADGVQFAMIRVGLRGTSTGALREDAYYARNIDGAMAQGIQTGAYIFSQAITVAEAIEEADFVIARLRNHKINGPVSIDWEMKDRSYRVYGTSKEMATACAVAFCKRVAAAGYTPMVYNSKYVAYIKYDQGALAPYMMWYPQYSPTSTEYPYPNLYYQMDYWQFTDSAVVEGIGKKIDANIWFKPKS